MISANFAADDPCRMLNRHRGRGHDEPLELGQVPLNGQIRVRSRRLWGYEGSDLGMVYDLQLGEDDFVRVAQSSDVPGDRPGDPALKAKSPDDAERVSKALHALAMRCGARMDTRFR
jgi:hypothetical protein